MFWCVWLSPSRSFGLVALCRIQTSAASSEWVLELEIWNAGGWLKTVFRLLLSVVPLRVACSSGETMRLLMRCPDCRVALQIDIRVRRRRETAPTAAAAASQSVWPVEGAAAETPLLAGGQPSEGMGSGSNTASGSTSASASAAGGSAPASAPVATGGCEPGGSGAAMALRRGPLVRGRLVAGPDGVYPGESHLGDTQIDSSQGGNPAGRFGDRERAGCSTVIDVPDDHTEEFALSGVTTRGAWYLDKRQRRA